MKIMIMFAVAVALALGFATQTAATTSAAKPSDRCDHEDQYTVGGWYHYGGGLCDQFEIDMATYINDFLRGRFEGIDSRAYGSHFPCVNPTPLTKLFGFHINDGGLEVNAPRDGSVWTGNGGAVVCATGSPEAIASNPFNVLQDEGLNVLAAWENFINGQVERLRWSIEPGCNPAAEECQVFVDSTRDLLIFEDMACRRYPGAFFCPPVVE